MSNQETQGTGDLQPAHNSAPDASARLSGDHVLDAQTMESDVATPELEVGSSHWSDSDSDSDYGEGREEQEDDDDDDDVTTDDTTSTVSADDDLDISHVEAKTNSERVAAGADDLDSALEDSGKEKEESLLDQRKYESCSADDYLALLSPGEAATSGAEESTIDQALFEDFDVDNSAAIAKHQEITSSSESLLADNFDADNSDLIRQYYSSNDAQGHKGAGQNEPTTSSTPKKADKQKKSRALSHVYIRPIPAFYYSDTLEAPAPRRRHKTSKPSSPGLKRSRLMGKPYSCLLPVSSPLNPDAPVSSRPSTPTADNKYGTRTRPQDSPVSLPAEKQVKAHKPNCSFEEPRAAPTPAGGTKHRRAGAVCDTVAYPESLLTTDEVLGLTGINRESSRAAVKEYKTTMKAMDAAWSQSALNNNRLKLNMELAGVGRPPVAVSMRDRAAHIAKCLQKRSELPNAFLQEYHERYGQLYEHYITLYQKLKTAEKDLMWVTGEHRDMEQAMLDVQKELEECFVDRRTDQDAHREECRLLQEQYDRLKHDTARLERERREATDSLQSLQEAFDTQQSSEKELNARLAEFETRNGVLKSEVEEIQQRWKTSNVELDTARREADLIREQLANTRDELATLHATSSHTSSDPQQQVYSYEGQHALHEHQMHIVQLQNEKQGHLEKEARLTALVQKAHKVVQTLEAQKTALALANESLQQQPPTVPLVSIAGITMGETAAWAQRRAAWRQTPEWHARREFHRQKAQQESEAHAAR